MIKYNIDIPILYSEEYFGEYPYPIDYQHRVGILAPDININSWYTDNKDEEKKKVLRKENI